MACRQAFHDLRIHFAYHVPRHHSLRCHFHGLKANIHGKHGNYIMFIFTAYFDICVLITLFKLYYKLQMCRLQTKLLSEWMFLCLQIKAPTNSWLLALSFRYSSIIQATMKISSDSTRHCDFLSLQLGSSTLQYDI